MQTGRKIYSDNWWLEGTNAYVCAAELGAVFCVDMVTNQCELLAKIPDCSFRGWRMNSYCRKYKDQIFCFPYDEKDICCYDMKNAAWRKLEIGFQGRLIACMEPDSADEKQVWLMEHMGRKIYQLNLEKETVECIYTIPLEKQGFSGFYVLVQDIIYCIARKTIHSIDIRDGNITTFDLPDISSELYTICFDGRNFWLSGYDGTIYVWNHKDGIVQTIFDLPDVTVGLCMGSNILIRDVPLFGFSASVGEEIWYMPLQCNAQIVYIDKVTFRVGVFDIEDEYETEESLESRGGTYKYVVGYIRGQRYIGVYSLKNEHFFEIDTVCKSVCDINYEFTPETMIQVAHNIYFDKGILHDTYKEEKEIFEILLNDGKRTGSIVSDIGYEIYRSIR